MAFKLAKQAATLATIVAVGVIGQAALANAAGAVAATKGELAGGQLRLEGNSAPGVFVIARSTTSTAGVRADPNGLFKIQAADFAAPDCTVTLTDGRTPTATVTLAGCTPSATAVPATPAPATGSCLINPQPPAALTAATPSVVYFQSTGCDTTTNSGATPTPVQWTVVAGSIPIGMSGPTSEGTTAGNIIGTPSTPGTYQFTLQVTDQIGATAQQTLTITVI